MITEIFSNRPHFYISTDLNLFSGFEEFLVWESFFSAHFNFNYTASTVVPSARETMSTIIDTILAEKSRISQWMLYDTLGSQIYEEIVAMEEYYLPAAERAVVNQFKNEIANPSLVLSAPPPLVAKQIILELGAGAGHRTLPLIECMSTKATFTNIVPTDISSEALRENREYYEASPNKCNDPTKVCYTPLEGTHEAVLAAAAEKFSKESVRNFMFMGSSLGNYDDEEIVELVTLVGSYLRSGTLDRLLLAVDLEHSESKPVERIVMAYDDPHGITSRFTLNALTHVNKVAKLNFNIDEWRHDVKYDENTSRIITHVVAKTRQVVRNTATGEDVRTFEEGDKIFIEQSRKFSTSMLEKYAVDSELTLTRQWSNGDFLIVELRKK